MRSTPANAKTRRRVRGEHSRSANRRCGERTRRAQHPKKKKRSSGKRTHPHTTNQDSTDAVERDAREERINKRNDHGRRHADAATGKKKGKRRFHAHEVTGLSSRRDVGSWQSSRLERRREEEGKRGEGGASGHQRSSGQPGSSAQQHQYDAPQHDMCSRHCKQTRKSRTWTQDECLRYIHTHTEGKTRDETPKQ